MNRDDGRHIQDKREGGTGRPASGHTERAAGGQKQTGCTGQRQTGGTGQRQTGSTGQRTSGGVQRKAVSEAGEQRPGNTRRPEGTQRPAATQRPAGTLRTAETQGPTGQKSPAAQRTAEQGMRTGTQMPVSTRKPAGATRPAGTQRQAGVRQNGDYQGSGGRGVQGKQSRPEFPDAGRRMEAGRGRVNDGSRRMEAGRGRVNDDRRHVGGRRPNGWGPTPGFIGGIAAATVVLIILVVGLTKAVITSREKADEGNNPTNITVTQLPTQAVSDDETLEPTQAPTEAPEIDTLDQSSLLDTGSIEYLKGLSSNGSVIEIIDGITYVEGQIIVNKTYALPSDYVPEGHDGLDLSEKDYDYEGVTQEVWDAYVLMKAAAEEEGLSLKPCSGYRSYSCQVGLWQAYADRDGEEAADTYSARAGYSEHQSGLCMDLNAANDSFTSTAEGKWLSANCWKYGFCIRFPEGKQEYTGYKYESWHVRYVGTELAEKLYNDGDWISLEEYFGLQSAYNN